MDGPPLQNNLMAGPKKGQTDTPAGSKKKHKNPNEGINARKKETKEQGREKGRKGEERKSMPSISFTRPFRWQAPPDLPACMSLFGPLLLPLLIGVGRRFAATLFVFLLCNVVFFIAPLFGSSCLFPVFPFARAGRVYFCAPRQTRSIHNQEKGTCPTRRERERERERESGSKEGRKEGIDTAPFRGCSAKGEEGGGSGRLCSSSWPLCPSRLCGGRRSLPASRHALTPAKFYGVSVVVNWSR
mmetsp:Transcript_13107/g.25734  ORF Transcript_13107/g.25734 Transcript_13107/m.25734 type:complete len:243 (+) Transcript_13107:1308-2036(+)